MIVLLIDDEEDMRAVVSMSLTALGGMQVIEAASGREGARLATREKPDLILLDLVMPEPDGRATLRMLQAEPSTREIPVVLLTASNPEDDALLALGAVGVIHKPFDPLALPSQVAAFVRTAG